MYHAWMTLCPEAKLLKRWRKRHGLSYAQAAKALAEQRGWVVYRHQIMNWEAGKGGMSQSTRHLIRDVIAAETDTPQIA